MIILEYSKDKWGKKKGKHVDATCGKVQVGLNQTEIGIATNQSKLTDGFNSFQ